MFKEFIIAPRFTFTREERLKSRKLIEVLFRDGQSFSHSSFRILYLFPVENNGPLQAGFAVSTKNFKKAVDRNKIKRQMKEAYRLKKNNLTSTLKIHKKCMAVFFIYTGKEVPKYSFVEEKILFALNRLNKIADEVIAADN